MITLRDFQLDCVNQLDGKKSAVLVAATGSGKTMIGAALSWREIQRSGRVAFVVPRDNLARQTASTIKKWGLSSGYILGNEPENRTAKVQILSYQSLGSDRRDLDWLGDQTTLWLVDECHITAFAQSLQPYLGNSNIKKIGLTATPWQLQKRSLLDIFDEPVFAPTVKELIERRLLAQPIYFRTTKKGKLAADPDYIYRVWEKYAYNEKTFIFAGSIAKSKAIAEHFQDQGIAAVSLTSESNLRLVESTFEKFRKGEIRVLVSCNKLAEGCDIPDATCVILANRTESMSGAIQRIGRGARIAPGKFTFKVIDCVGTIRKFGRFEEIVVSEIDFIRKEPDGRPMPEMRCQHCDAYSPISARVCVNCGKAFDFVEVPLDNPGHLERLVNSRKEARAIASFHTLLIEEFKQRSSFCEKEFLRVYGYYPPDHWVVDCDLPPAMRSPIVDKAWKDFKFKVSSRLPKGYIQLSLNF